MSPLIACCTVAWVSLPSPSSSTKVCSSHPVTWKVAFAVVMAPVLCLIHTYVQVWATLTQVCTTLADGARPSHHAPRTPSRWPTSPADARHPWRRPPDRGLTILEMCPGVPRPWTHGRRTPAWRAGHGNHGAALATSREPLPCRGDRT